jgi:hypothetical protein
MAWRAGNRPFDLQAYGFPFVYSEATDHLAPVRLEFGARGPKDQRQSHRTA